MYIKELDRIGIVIDTITAIIISVVILLLISWLLEITGNSFYTHVIVLSYIRIPLIYAFLFIEWFWGPIIIQFIYRDEFKKERERKKIEIEIYKKNPFPIAT